MNVAANAWWNEITDRVFLKEVYKDVGKHLDSGKVLDIGVESYNSVCKHLLNNDKVEYWQLDPNKVSRDNDGFLHCTMQEAVVKYPQIQQAFDCIFDIGVFCWNGTRFNRNQQQEYIKNVSGLLRPNGIYILHGDRIEEDPEYKIDIENFIYPHFELFDFMSYKQIETITCPTHGTIWDIRFLRKK